MMNEIINLLLTNLTYKIISVLIFGLCIGSFLNVVVYRLPIMLNQTWRNQCIEIFADECQLKADTSKFNLMTPRSHCPKCKTLVPWWSNIPLFGYMFLAGKCVKCKTTISLRYPLVELATGILFVLATYSVDNLLILIGRLVLVAILITLMLIDLDTFLLPDELTLPLIWLGLLFNLTGDFSGSLVASVIGAAVGYLSLWSLYWLFKLVTGKEGMGYGDFKLLAALGAWLGWQSLISILILSSVCGIFYAIGLRLSGKLNSGNPIPFGPFLGMAGILMLFTPASCFTWLGM
ncbi:MAG: hypothetical protein RLZZ293_1488 [Pseudomonadota bacterium]|jgi:leader peptidase (prepilin peptidase)/N-methyltransferase